MVLWCVCWLRCARSGALLRPLGAADTDPAGRRGIASMYIIQLDMKTVERDQPKALVLNTTIEHFVSHRANRENR
jgi:hypothetical protein